MTSIEDTETNTICSFDFTGRHIMVVGGLMLKFLNMKSKF